MNIYKAIPKLYYFYTQRNLFPLFTDLKHLAADVCLRAQMDWINFPNTTEPYIYPAAGPTANEICCTVHAYFVTASYILMIHIDEIV